MNPFTLIPRYKSLRKSGRPKTKRSIRRGPLRCKPYREWLKNRVCCVSFVFGCDPCHTENNGMSSKGPDSSCVPLVRSLHREYDAGREAFEAKYGIDMKKTTRDYWRIWVNEVASKEQLAAIRARWSDAVVEERWARF